MRNARISAGLPDSGTDSQVPQRVNSLPAMWETQVQFLGQEDSLKKKMATHSSIPAWKIPWTEESGGPQSTELRQWDKTEHT